MRRAIELAAAARTRTSPNPWVGCRRRDRRRRASFEGATEPPGGPPRRGRRPRRPPARPPAAPRVYTTLEPCSHHGRTPPCADAVDRRRRRPGRRRHRGPRPAGRRARASPGCGRPASRSRSASRADDGRGASSRRTSTTARTGRPYVVLKLAADARRPHRRARRHRASGSPATRPAPTPTACGPRATPSLVGAGTVRADDPSLTVAPRRRAATRCGSCSARAPAGAKVHPCARARRRPRRRARRARRAAASLQVLVEGGADRRRTPSTAAGLVDRYVAVPRAGAVRRRRRPRPVRRPGRADDRRRVARPHRRRSTQLGDDLRIDARTASRQEA